MQIPFQDRLIDIVLDVLDWSARAKEWIQKNKRASHIILACFILGSSTGFASAILLPKTVDSKLILASALDAQNTQKQLSNQKQLSTSKTLAEQASSDEALEEKMSEEVLQNISTQVILQQQPELCEKDLAGKYVTLCKDSYWKMQASLAGNVGACDKISTPEGKSACTQEIKSKQSGTIGLSDEEIKKNSEACLAIEGEKNQNVCWNSLFLSIALNTGDASKCENIKDANTKVLCVEKSKESADQKTQKEAIEAKDYAKCQTITNEKIGNTCKQEVMKVSLTPSTSCDATCVDVKVLQFAVDQTDTNVCNKASTEANKLTCKDKVYAQIALKKLDSSYCSKVTAAADQSSCKAAITADKDKNPEVQLQVFKESDRAFPSVGESLSNPLTANPFVKSSTDSFDLNSILGDYNRMTAPAVSSSTQDSVCKFYTDAKQKEACEDTLILQVAIPNKDVTQCQYVKEQTTRDYCELEIVQGDALRAAEAAKQKCQTLSSATAVQKCLRSLGFSSPDIKAGSNLECLDYPTPEDRIACMRNINSSSSATKSTDGIEEITNPNQVEDIIQDSLQEIN